MSASHDWRNWYWYFQYKVIWSKKQWHFWMRQANDWHIYFFGISIIRTAFNLQVTDVQLNVLRIGIRSFSLRFALSKRDKISYLYTQISAIGNKYITKANKKSTYEERSIFTTNLNGSGKYTCLIQKSSVPVTHLAAKAPFIYR